MSNLKLKSFLFLVVIILLSGCVPHGRKGLFAKESDTLIKSSCEDCQQEPFYVNGRWL